MALAVDMVVAVPTWPAAADGAPAWSSNAAASVALQVPIMTASDHTSSYGTEARGCVCKIGCIAVAERLILEAAGVRNALLVE